MNVPRAEAPLISRTPPEDPAALRRAIYEGTIFHLPPTPASERLRAEVTALLEEELGPAPRLAQFRLNNEEFFARIGRLRKIFFTEPRFHQALREVLGGCGQPPTEQAFDPLRLRVIAHRGFEDPRAAPVYYAHRDTWYAHPQCLITWWLALHEAAEEETFVFYPEYFTRPVPNSSDTFDYSQWVRDGWELKIGWQKIDAGQSAHYPGQTAPVEIKREVGFTARAGDLVLFSGAHFHMTRKNLTGRTRFSLDFRTVHLSDHERGLGAPNADNRSWGSALRDYVMPVGQQFCEER